VWSTSLLSLSETICSERTIILTMLDSLNGLGSFLLLVVGFGLVIFVHELGHFVAAKSVGIKVLRFAIGFGPAACAWRRGIGFRAGSTDDTYRRRVISHLAEADPDGSVTEPSQADVERAARQLGLGETEYRINWVPLGGYVMMMGQDDLAPGDAPVEDPRSYSSKPVWARMIVISAGVIMNLITAALLFIAVYMHGIDKPAPRVGQVIPDGVAARTEALNATQVGVDEPGLQPGDLVLRVNDKEAESFQDVLVEVAMARRDQAVRMLVERDGVDGLLQFELEPEFDPDTKLLDIGVYPSTTATLYPELWETPTIVSEYLEPNGLDVLRPGMSLVELDGTPVRRYADIDPIVDRSTDGSAMVAVWEDEQGVLTTELKLEPDFESDAISIVNASGTVQRIDVAHLLGLTPLMRVERVDRTESGLADGDLFVRVGPVSYPNEADAIALIRQSAGRRIDVTVLRDGELVDLTPRVDRDGRIGFIPGRAVELSRISRPPAELMRDGETFEPAAERLQLVPGSRIVAVNEVAVVSFADLREALFQSTASAHDAGEGDRVALTVELLVDAGADAVPEETIWWDLTADDVRTLHDLGWATALSATVFEPELKLVKASNPVAAMSMGLGETWDLVVMTYLTFDRLFIQRTVKVEHLKGPVGIAELGTRFASQGFIHLLLFLAMISVNLAVINFLPIPVVDGGQFVFLLIEKIKGSPVSPGIQNAATVVGLLIIGAVVLITFYNDMANLLQNIL
jgi:regulator of sigma E protease